jgi:hypothetical protein
MARVQVPFLQVVTGGYVLVEDFCSLLAGRRLELTVKCPTKSFLVEYFPVYLQNNMISETHFEGYEREICASSDRAAACTLRKYDEK